MSSTPELFFPPDICIFFLLIILGDQSLIRIWFFLWFYRSLPSIECYEILPVKTRRLWGRVQCMTNWGYWMDRIGLELTHGTPPIWACLVSLPQLIPTNQPPLSEWRRKVRLFINKISIYVVRFYIPRTNKTVQCITQI